METIVTCHSITNILHRKESVDWMKSVDLLFTMNSENPSLLTWKVAFQGREGRDQ